MFVLAKAKVFLRTMPNNNVFYEIIEFKKIAKLLAFLVQTECVCLPLSEHMIFFFQ